MVDGDSCALTCTVHVAQGARSTGVAGADTCHGIMMRAHLTSRPHFLTHQQQSMHVTLSCSTAGGG